MVVEVDKLVKTKNDSANVVKGSQWWHLATVRIGSNDINSNNDNSLVNKGLSSSYFIDKNCNVSNNGSRVGGNRWK
jgi:hypothetical protein